MSDREKAQELITRLAMESGGDHRRECAEALNVLLDYVDQLEHWKMGAEIGMDEVRRERDRAVEALKAITRLSFGEAEDGMAHDIAHAALGEVKR